MSNIKRHRAYLAGYTDFMNRKEALSVERTGEWITEKGSYEIICSKCGCEAFSKYGEWFKSDYCPNCGAKMKGGTENE